MSDLVQARLLIDSRRYDEALAILTSGGAPVSPDWLAERRRCLARLNRFAEAVEVGRQVLALAAGGASAEDWFRHSQICARAGFLRETAEAAFQALDREQRPAFLSPLVEAFLRDPALMRGMEASISGLSQCRPRGVVEIDGTRLPSPPAPVSAPIQIPMRLPYYVPLCADHPFVMGWVHQNRDLGFSVTEASADFTVLEEALAFARQRFTELRRLHPAVTAEAAAAYVASRFESLLHPAPGARVDFLSMAVMSLGQRPYVLGFDYLPVLFHPFFPYEDMAVGRDSPFYWIVRESLESPACAAIVTTYASSAGMLGRYFSSPVIEAKCRFINPCFSLDETLDPERGKAGPDDAEREPATLLFTASRNATGESFYARGGVDVLCAFERLAPVFPDLRLLLRTPLPSTLAPRLRRLVESHPRIEWYPDPLPWPTFRALFRRAGLFALPGVTAYRNGLVQAMGWGVVPLVSDGAHMDELVRDGTTGVIVTGRAGLSAFDEREGRFVQRWTSLLRATDRPADPVFAAAYEAALRRLLEEPARLARLRASLALHADPNRITERDLVRFRSTMAGALKRATEPGGAVRTDAGRSEDSRCRP